MPDPTYPVLWYVVSYADCGPRCAAMAFSSYRDFRVSRDFMAGNDHYRIKLIEFLTEFEINSLGINFTNRQAA